MSKKKQNVINRTSKIISLLKVIKKFLKVDGKIAFQENDYQMQKQENGINFYLYKEQ